MAPEDGVPDTVFAEPGDAPPEPPHAHGTAGRVGVPGLIAIAWAVGGFSALILFALIRLGGVVLASGLSRFGATEAAALALSVLVMAWAEGYRGFQRKFSPRFAARAVGLHRNPGGLRAWLAPLTCMGLLFAPRRRLISAWALTGGIVLLIALVRMMPQPWRAVVDAGVVAGLGWGLVATWFAVARALRSGPQVAAEFSA